MKKDESTSRHNPNQTFHSCMAFVRGVKYFMHNEGRWHSYFKLSTVNYACHMWELSRHGLGHCLFNLFFSGPKKKIPSFKYKKLIQVINVVLTVDSVVSNR